MTPYKYGAIIRKLRKSTGIYRYLEKMKVKWAKIMIKRIKLNTGMNVTKICEAIKCDRQNLGSALKGKRSLPMKIFCDLIDLDNKIFVQLGK